MACVAFIIPVSLSILIVEGSCAAVPIENRVELAEREVRITRAEISTTCSVT